MNEDQMSVPYKQGMRYFDLYHGVELQPKIVVNNAVLNFAVEAYGYGAVLATSGNPDGKFQELMAKMKSMTEKPVSYTHLCCGDRRFRKGRE